MLLLSSLPFVEKDILSLAVDDCKVSQCVIAGRQQCCDSPRLVFFLRICNVAHLFLIVLHNFGLGTVLPRIVKTEFLSEKV